MIVHEAPVQESRRKLTPLWHGQLWVTVLLPNRYSNDGATGFEPPGAPLWLRDSLRL
jgi:hypothetical protein